MGLKRKVIMFYKINYYFKQLLLYQILALICLVPQASAFNMLGCDVYKLEFYEDLKTHVQLNPKDVNALYELGMGVICMGRTLEGLSYILQAADLKDPIAAVVVAAYYKSDKTFKNGIITKNLQNYKSAIHYFEKAVHYIESNKKYPEGYYWTYEKKTHFSVTTFLSLVNLYHMEYILNLEGVFATDTLTTLNKLHSMSEKCLKRPSLSAWGEEQKIIYHFQQTKCQSYFDMSKELIPLEKKRLRIIKSCPANLNSCEEYKQIISTIAQTSNHYAEKIKSIQLKPFL